MNVKHDLTGMKFGKLTAISRGDDVIRSNGRSRVTWLCKCECGNQVNIRRDHLLRKTGSKATSCGCKLAGKLFQVSGYSQGQKILASYLQGAKQRNLAWSLSEGVGLSLISGDCHYCGAKPASIAKSLTRRARLDNFAYNGIDRLDPAVGYEEDNCVSCCATCNYFKGGRTEDEFIRHIFAIYSHVATKQSL